MDIKSIETTTTTVDKKTKTDSMYILVQCKHNTLTVGKDIIRYLGFPTHVCLRINATRDSFIIFPCKPDDVMSFKVPEHLFTDAHCSMRIHSKQFLYHIVTANSLDDNYVYSYSAHYVKDKNLVLVNLNDESIRHVSYYSKMPIDIPV